MTRRYPLSVLVAALVVPALTLPVYAQDTAEESTAGGAGESAEALCAGLGGEGEWIGGDPAGSDMASRFDAFDEDVRIFPNGQFVRLFQVTSEADLRFEAVPRSSGDPYLTVYDAEGDEVGSDDDGGGDLAARIDTTLTPGAYCVVASSYDRRLMDISFRLGRAEHEAITNPDSSGRSGGNSLACASSELAVLSDEEITAEQLAEGLSEVASVAQTPAWGFTLAEPLALSIRAQSDSGDPVIRLRNEEGVLLAENDDADGTNSRIDQTSALSAGSYCIEMEDLDGDNNAIRVGLSLFDPAENRLRGIDAAELSPLPDDDIAIRELGTLGASAVVDVAATAAATWLQFEVPEAGVVAFEALGVDIDPLIVLFDRVGRVVGENDDGPDDLNSLLVQRLPAGSYLLAVRLTADDNGAGNVRVFMERFVPAK